MIETRCPNCGKTVKGKDEFAGRRVTCPACDTVFVLSGESGGTSVSGEVIEWLSGAEKIAPRDPELSPDPLHSHQSDMPECLETLQALVREAQSTRIVIKETHEQLLAALRPVRFVAWLNIISFFIGLIIGGIWWVLWALSQAMS